MSTANVYNLKGDKVDTVNLIDKVFGIRPNEHVVYEYVKMQLANRRAGTHSALTRSEVNGTTSKPWRQKGTGRARAGTTKSPLWTHGGVVFPPKPRDYSMKMNKKVKKLAIRSVLTAKAREEKVFILENIEMNEPKTRVIAMMLGKIGLDHAVIVDHAFTEEAKKSIRNIKNAKYLDVEGLNVFDLLKYRNLIFTRKALSKIEELYS